MKVLIACEFSGIVRDAFIAKGHDAWSCDILPTEKEGPHIQGDVLEILDGGWDMMIAHPPCTYLSNVANKHYNEEMYGKKAIERKKKREEAINFFYILLNAPIKKIAIENPIGILSTRYRKPDQIIQPYYFGDNEQKTTCLWLKNIPKLLYNNNYEKPNPTGWTMDKNGKIKSHYFTDMPPNEKLHRSLVRSRTFQGIANAMANQWGNINNESYSTNDVKSLSSVNGSSAVPSAKFEFVAIDGT